MIRLIVFDWDGTLHDSLPVKKKTIARVLHEVSRLPIREAEYFFITHVGMHRNQIIDAAIRKLGKRKPSRSEVEKVSKEYYSRLVTALRSCKMFPDAPKALRELKREGHVLALLSAATQNHYRPVLLEEGLSKIFDSTLSLRENESKSAVLKNLMRRFHSKPSETALVGDSIQDMKEARKARVITIGRIGTFKAPKLRGAGAQIVLKDFKRLPVLLASTG